MYRAVVVDDEKLSCDFISKYISEHIDCGFKITASFLDSVEALEYLKENNAELVITDIRMPNLNGLELIKKLHEINPKIRIIIISGFPEFSYVHTAIKYSVHDYILKPIDPDELAESLAKLKDDLDNDEKQNFKNFEDTENFFSMLLNSKLKKKAEIEKEMKKINFPDEIDELGGEIYNINFLNFENYSAQNWKYGKKGLMNAIINVLNLHFHYRYVYCISENTGFFTLVVFFQKDNSVFFDEEIIDVYKNYINVDLKILGRVSFENIYEIPKKMSLSKVFNINFDKLFEALILGNKEELLFEINRFEEKGYKKSDIVSNLGKLLKSKKFDINLTEEDLTDEKKLKALFKKIEKQSEDDAKIQLMQYIEKNYMLDMTRDEVAGKMYVSQSYFSIYFKNLMGCSFKEYLLSVRMEKAKLMLTKETNPRVVAKQVGYNEYRYFKKKFLEYTGFTPEEYSEKIFYEQEKR